ncbi:ribonucleotide-diphosphate reductase subunit beta [Variovorax paradoxus]|uniref:Ribonucleoside-diphosphate reductase subunit beta n=1 Tax=Variovorax paradoxus TaxID=34073 RepID=A0A5Q0M5S8_VARPD|nr:ribonucleotide-diphosphate reductase subunit beta [Variovorax paradoxus]QFZ84538.1 ribonucleotide-diphosphate reductase subunit beta [Variovorax paradoxus]
MNMSRVKYQWAVDIHEEMVANFWTEKKVPMGGDKQCYLTQLSPQERRAYDLALAFVSNLDGIQFNNLIQNIGQHVTAPEVSGALARQAAEEYMHVRVYQTMIEAVSLNPEEIYLAFEKDGLLAQKNAYIMGQSDILKGDPTPASFARAIVGNLILEGIYFYNAFLVFGSLAQNGKMLGSADNIKYIARDEGGTHLELFSHMHGTFREENPHLYDAQFYADAEALFRGAVELECTWGKHMVGSGIAGLTPSMMDAFPKHLANLRWQIVKPGAPDLYPGVVSPAPWFFQFFKVNGSRQNFFETTVVDYDQSGLEW